MEAQHKIEIGQRIWRLREDSVQTNRSIGDYCGVDTRTVAGWVAGEGISYKNAKKVAELFKVDVQQLWAGEDRKATPDPFADGQIHRVEREIAELRVDVAELGVDLAQGKAQQQKWRKRRRGLGSSEAPE